MKQHKKFNPFDHAMDTAILSGGVAGTGMMLAGMNNATGNHIDTGPTMNMLGALPMLHATKGVFMSLEDLKPKRRHR